MCAGLISKVWGSVWCKVKGGGASGTDASMGEFYDL